MWETRLRHFTPRPLRLVRAETSRQRLPRFVMRSTQQVGIRRVFLGQPIGRLLPDDSIECRIEIAPLESAHEIWSKSSPEDFRSKYQTHLGHDWHDSRLGADSAVPLFKRIERCAQLVVRGR